MMKPRHRLYLIGALLLATMLVLARTASVVGGPGYLATLTVAALLYLMMIREFTRTSTYAPRVIYACLVLGTVWQIPFFVVVPGPEDDVLRYVWDGRLQKLGYDPYLAIPSDPALAGLHTAETRRMNNQDVASPYPAGAQLFFRAVTAVSESAFAFKVAIALCHFAIVVLLAVVLGRTGQLHWVLAYAWHPLLATCVFYNSHIDTLGVLLLLTSVVALQERRRTLATVALALAVTVKFLPAVLAPLYWKRVRTRDVLCAAGVVLLLYFPFLHSGRLPTGSIQAFVQRFRFNDPVFAAVSRLLRPQLAAALAVVCGLATAMWMRSRKSNTAWESWGWPLAVSLVFLPVIYPWYLLWLVPFLRGGATATILIWTLSISFVFYVWHSHNLGQPWQVPGWILALEFGPVALVAGGAVFKAIRSEA